MLLPSINTAPAQETASIPENFVIPLTIFPVTVTGVIEEMVLLIPMPAGARPSIAVRTQQLRITLFAMTSPPAATEYIPAPELFESSVPWMFST